jgi:hypothetical protein
MGVVPDSAVEHGGRSPIGNGAIAAGAIKALEEIGAPPVGYPEGQKASRRLLRHALKLPWRPR